MPSATSTRVFVSGLPEYFEEESLRDLFEPQGSIVDCQIVWTFGFVEFEREDAAAAAVKQFNKWEISDGHKLNVMRASLATQLTTLPASSSSGSSGSSGSSNGVTRSSAHKKGVTSRLFVGNLDDGVTKDDLISIFESFGKITATEMKKSYGFVRFDSLEAASAAKAGMDRKDVRGKPLRIDFAEPRRKSKLFVGNITTEMTADDLREAFEAYGIVLDAMVFGKYGFVHFDDDGDAQKATDALNNREVKGSKIRVEVSTSEPGAPSKGSRGEGCFKCGLDGHFAKGCPGWSAPLKRPRMRSPDRREPYRYDRYDPYAPPSRDPYGDARRPDSYGRDPYYALPKAYVDDYDRRPPRDSREAKRRR